MIPMSACGLLWILYFRTQKSCGYFFVRYTQLASSLTHWGRVTHICVSKLTIIGSDNGLSPGRRQAIIWTNAGILLIWPLGTNFSEIAIDIQTFSFKKIHFKMPSGKLQPFCLGLNVLTPWPSGKCGNLWTRINVNSWALVKLLSEECHAGKKPLMINQHKFG